MQYLNKAVFRATSSLKQSSLSKYIASAVRPPVRHISGREHGTTWGIHTGQGVTGTTFSFWKLGFPQQIHPCLWDKTQGLNLFPSHPVRITKGSGTANFAQESVWKRGGTQRVRTEAGNEGEMSEVAIWKNNSCCGAREKMKTHTEFSIHRTIDNYMHTYAYIHIKGFRGYGRLSSSTDTHGQITQIFAEFHQLQGIGLARLQRACFTGHLCEGIQDPIRFESWRFDTKTSGEPKKHWTPGHVETRAAPTAGGGMLEASSKRLRCFRFPATTWRSGLALGCF